MSTPGLDEDVDLVTLRVPRRAAALIEAQLEFAASPLLVSTQIAVGYVVAAAPAIIGLGLLLGAIFSGVEFKDLWLVGLIALFTWLLGAGIFCAARTYHKAVRHRLSAAAPAI